MGRQMYPPKDFDDTKVHVMALTGQKKTRKNLQHGSVEHISVWSWELCLAMGPRHGLYYLFIGAGSRI